METRDFYDASSNNHYEYLMVVNPDAPANEKAIGGQFFSNGFQQAIGVKTLSYIIFACFIAKEAMENTIIRYIGNICRTQRSFPVILDNYNTSPSQTIFLSVRDVFPFEQFAKQLQVVNDYITSCDCPPMKIVSKPHATIAGEREVYGSALTQYAQGDLHESFMVRELLLLRRKHPHESCKTIHVFGLPPGDNELLD